MQYTMWNVAMLIIALVVVKISHWVYRWSNPKCKGKLPPGSMGFPIIGETLDYFKPSAFGDIPSFVKKRILRYGPVFRTNLFGSNTVVSTDHEINHEIFRQENTSFGIGYPEKMISLFGKDNLFLKNIHIHQILKRITMPLLGPEGLKRSMMGIMDKAIRDDFRLKATQGSFDVKKEVGKLVVAYVTPKMISNLKREAETKFMKSLDAFNLDWFQSFSAVSTWKAFNKIFEFRREVLQVMKDALRKRIQSREDHSDFLNTMLQELEKDGSIFDEGSAINLMFLLSFTSRDGTAIFTALAVKFILQNPKVLAELQREHKGIVETREDKEGGVTWEEYRHNMPFTNMVINESLRVANSAPLILRKALHDVEIKGYTFPAGWVVAVAPSVVHYDPAIYENPYEFNPWRWEGKEMIWGSKTFMAFGGGARLCLGAEFARLQMALYIHHLAAYYDISLVQDCKVTHTPFLQFNTELLINISECSNK